MVTVNGVTITNDCANSPTGRVTLTANSGDANVIASFAGSTTLVQTVTQGNTVTLASTTSADRGEVNVGIINGPDVDKTVYASFYLLSVAGSGCQVVLSGIAS